MVKQILFFCVFVWTCVFAFGEENKLYGPDGKLCVIVSDEGGVPSYSVLYEGVTFLQKSPLGDRNKSWGLYPADGINSCRSAVVCQ